MNISNLYNELKRRNVFRVATAYAIAGWLIIQVSDTVFPRLGLPEWTVTFIITLVLIGLPISLIMAWAFELTPDGIHKSNEIEITESVTRNTGKKINGLIIGVLSVAVIFLLVDRVFFAPTISDVPTQLVSKVSSQSVAVLPFADLSENKDQDWFSDGLTEEILNSLAQLPELQVTSRTSAFQFKGKDFDISLIADTLGVANVVEGSVRRIGDQLRITAQLIRAEDGFHLWSETYDSNTDNLFEVQTNIAEEIAATLDVFLDEERRESMFATGTRNVEAFQEFLKGMEKYREAHNISDLDLLWKANEHFDNALELDPDFGLASIIKMDAYAHLLVDPGTSSQVMTLEEARDGLIESLKYGAEHTEDAAERTATNLNVVFFSDSWYQLPVVKDQLKTDMNGAPAFPRGNNWATEIFSLFGEEELVKSDTDFGIEVNRFGLQSWIYKASEVYKREGLIAAREVFQESRKYIGNNLFLQKFEHFMIAMENEDDMLRAEYPNGLTNWESEDFYFLGFNAFIAASLNEDDLATQLIDTYISKVAYMDGMMIFALFELGRIEEAKENISYLDSLPAGPTNLALDIATFGNILFFDLEDAPNTVARFEEAGIDVSIFKKMPWVD